MREQFPLVCGGYFPVTENCYTLMEHSRQWEKVATLSTTRSGAASAVLNKTKLFVVGGRDQYGQTLRSSEYIELSESGIHNMQYLLILISKHNFSSLVLILINSLSSEFFNCKAFETFLDHKNCSINVVREGHQCVQTLKSSKYSEHSELGIRIRYSSL